MHTPYSPSLARWLAEHSRREGKRAHEDGSPDAAGMYCGRCGTDAWTPLRYKCPGCGDHIPAAKRG